MTTPRALSDEELKGLINELSMSSGVGLDISLGNHTSQLALEHISFLNTRIEELETKPADIPDNISETKAAIIHWLKTRHFGGMQQFTDAQLTSAVWALNSSSNAHGILIAADSKIERLKARIEELEQQNKHLRQWARFPLS